MALRARLTESVRATKPKTCLVISTCSASCPCNWSGMSKCIMSGPRTSRPAAMSPEFSTQLARCATSGPFLMMICIFCFCTSASPRSDASVRSCSLCALWSASCVSGPVISSCSRSLSAPLAVALAAGWMTVPHAFSSIGTIGASGHDSLIIAHIARVERRSADSVYSVQMSGASAKPCGAYGARPMAAWSSR